MKFEDIAVIGMQVRVAGAQTPWEYFSNIKNKKVSITHFEQPQGWIGAKGIIEDVECFDADFFQISDRDANLLDPQHRLLLESVWQALEIAGYQPKKINELTALIASCSANIHHWFSLKDSFDNSMLSNYQNLLANDKDFLSTRIAHKLNLKGPTYTVQSGCSSSLLAVHQACRLLQARECNMAIVGGVSIIMPIWKGYPIVEGMIYSSSGKCRPFSKEADGTVEGMGAAVLILKRLEDAVNKKDHIWGLIKGSAVNNDGSNKMNFTSPSVDQQIVVMREALKRANISADSIEYIEAHGTGTAIGDAIELTAFQDVYGKFLSNNCYIGSVKANIGHLDVASGIVGLAKAIMCLKYGWIPPQPGVFPLHDLMSNEKSRLSFTETLLKWNTLIKRAAVSSLGVGGTNVHMILENYSCDEPKTKPVFKIFRKDKYPSPANKKIEKTIEKSSFFDPLELVASIWQNVLGSPLNPLFEDHFFKKGGNSLSAIEFVNKINTGLNIKISSVVLYEFPLFGDLLNHILNQINMKNNLKHRNEEGNAYYTEL